MNPKIVKSIVSGIVATAVMSLVMFLGPFMGLPEMNAAQMLADMAQLPIEIGWMMHFIIGIIFASGYVFLLNEKLPIGNDFLRAGIYGFIVFIFAQVMLGVMSLVMPAPEPPPGVNMLLMMVGSIIGHLVYGAVLGFFIKR
ncbi:MAG: DUF6789 family protein [Bacteroidia bacterium]